MKAEEEIGTYPPRFQVTINHPSRDITLNTEFTITLESDGILIVDQVREFPLFIPLPKLTTEAISGIKISIYIASYIIISYIPLIYHPLCKGYLELHAVFIDRA